MVCFDALGFEDIRIYRSLCQEFDAFELLCFFGKDVDEDGTDDLSLGLRISYALEFL